MWVETNGVQNVETAYVILDGDLSFGFRTGVITTGRIAEQESGQEMGA